MSAIITELIPYTPIEMAQNNILSVSEDAPIHGNFILEGTHTGGNVILGETLHVGCKIAPSFWQTVWKILRNIYFQYDPAILFLDIYQEK